MPLSAAIFDLDGVIVDTVPIHFKAWQRMFGEYGKAFTFDDYKRKVDGIPRMDGARAVLTELTEEELKTAAAKKQSYFIEALGNEDVPTYETTIKLIDDLLADGIKVAVISSSKNCPDILKRIGLYERLDTVISGSDIKRGKPDPEIFLMAAQRLYTSPDESLVFEDAVLGVKAAMNAGMKCVGIDRYGDPRRLSGANIIVSDLDEVDLAKLKALF
jgi:beta-phosphoglucomutase